MKKGCAWGLAVFAFAVVLILGIVLMVAVPLRDRAVGAREPLSLEEIAEVGKKMEGAVGETARTPDAVAEPKTEIDPEKVAALPKRLSGTPTHEMLAKRFSAQRPDQVRRAKRMASLFKLAEGAVALFSDTEAAGLAWERGHELLALQDWEGARKCFLKSLEEPLHPGILKFACNRLAWLEDDPEKALRYLEMSCMDEDSSWLGQAIILCRNTGSRELDRYFLARLRLADPEQARSVEQQEQPQRNP